MFLRIQYFEDVVVVYKHRAVNVALYTADGSLGGILPHYVFPAVTESWGMVLIECNKEGIMLEAAMGKVFVVKINVGIDYWWPTIVFFNSCKEVT